jgi:hypothetical protein
MRKITIGAEQLFDPRVSVEHHHVEPLARLRVARNVEVVLPFSEFREWLGTVGLELGNAEQDTLAGYTDSPNTTFEATA